MTAPTAYLTEHEEGDMLWFDLQEARTYCAEGEEPVSLYAASELPPLPALPILPATQQERATWVRWATEYGQACYRAGLLGLHEVEGKQSGVCETVASIDDRHRPASL